MKTTRALGLVAIALVGILSVASAQPPTQPQPQVAPIQVRPVVPPRDAFAILATQGSSEATPVPPRALAVIPERHLERRIRIRDVLVVVDPFFSPEVRGEGLTGRNAIQLRTREAHVPVFIAKNEGNIATLLQIPMGATIEVTGVLVERANTYLFLASDIRLVPSIPPRRGRVSAGEATEGLRTH